LPACSQFLSFGVIGGGIATEGLDPGADNIWDGKWYTVGVTAEMKLPLPRLSVEVDALFRHAGQRNLECVFSICSYSEVRANIFEFPALLKYRFAKGAAAVPFVDCGPAYQWVRHGSGPFLVGSVAALFPVGSIPLAAENHVGIVAGGGIELRAGWLRLSPEFRYTRWNSAYWESFGSRGFFTASNLNQVQGLMSVRF
jgi:hypothetical protein